MKTRYADLYSRRQGLLERIDVQRMEVTEIAQSWQKPLALVDTGLKAVNFVRAHPGLVSGGFAALLSLRSMGMAGLAKKGWRIFFLYPAAASLGLKYLFSAIRPPADKRHPGG